MEAGERKKRATGLLLLLALALAFGGFVQPGYGNADIVRAIYFSTATVLIGIAVVIWAWT